MVFLDYASTCPIVKFSSQQYGGFHCNPNAAYAFAERKVLMDCEERIKAAIGVKGGKVVFGGTSSQLIENLMNVILSSSYGCDVFCSKYEHDSFFRYRDDSFYNEDELKSLLNQVDKYTVPIVLWQAVQNITGEIFPAKQIGELVHQYHGFYICDGTAQIGHTPIEPDIDDWCDFYCFSGHKLGTELGIGCCWVSDRLNKWLNGFKLHGTPNLAGALAMAQAVEDSCDNHKLSQDSAHYAELLDYLIDGLIENGIDFQLVPEYENNEPSNKFTLTTIAIRLPGFNADALQQFLASRGIYVGVGGSACSAAHDYRVLRAYGLTDGEASEVIRVSFGDETTASDIEALVEGIKEYLRQFC